MVFRKKIKKVDLKVASHFQKSKLWKRCFLMLFFFVKKIFLIKPPKKMNVL